jgi:hypothetical protein
VWLPKSWINRRLGVDNVRERHRPAWPRSPDIGLDPGVANFGAADPEQPGRGAVSAEPFCLLQHLGGLLTMTHMTKSTRAMLLGAAALIGGCQTYDILNTNVPTVELTGTPRVPCWHAAGCCPGTERRYRHHPAVGYLWPGGTTCSQRSREAIEEIRNRRSPGRASRSAAATLIRTINIPGGLTMVGIFRRSSASEGFAKTIKAWHLRGSPSVGRAGHADRRGPPSPIRRRRSEADAMAGERLLDEANADLWPAARRSLHRGRASPASTSARSRSSTARSRQGAGFLPLSSCAPADPDVRCASFITTANLPASLAPACTPIPPQQVSRQPVSENATITRYWVHPSILTDAQLRTTGSHYG